MTMMLANNNFSPPPALIPWLTHQASLTEKLKQIAGETTLTVLKQVWKTANWWDRFVLDRGHETFFQREILISANKEPCWYARTLIPQTSYDAHRAFFARLQHQSLGELIFNNNDITRQSLSHYAIDAQSIEYYWLDASLAKDDVLWVRVSAFNVKNNAPFFLIEILLPALARYSL